MSCMRCGRDVISNQVFCEDCLQTMERYPVNPNTPVILPKQPSKPAHKKAVRKRTVSLEDQIFVLKHRVRLLTVLVIAFALLAALMVYPAVQYLREDHFLPGQNYTSIVSKTTETDAAP